MTYFTQKWIYIFIILTLSHSVLAFETYEIIDNNAMNAMLSLSNKQATALGSGGWSDSVVGPNLYSEGQWYTSNEFQSPTPVPFNAKITKVTWEWSVDNKPSDLLVYICDASRGGCLNVSQSGSGGTDAFDGRRASNKFEMWFGVPGSGSIWPIAYGQKNTINVSWSN